MSRLVPPCAYQGGKQRLSDAIAQIILKELDTDGDSKFYDLCCGSGAISMALINNGINPNRITMVDMSPWGSFYKAIGEGSFDISKFERMCEDIPKDPADIKDYMKSLSKKDPTIDTEYIFLLLQASSFGSKAIWHSGGKWRNCTFRSYWQPTATSSRRSPVNPMMPMPSELLKRVSYIANNMRGVTGIQGDAAAVEIEKGSVVYCDPPYKGTTGYGYSLDIDKVISNSKGSVLFVSEGYKMSEEAFLLSSGRDKGGVSGKRSSSNAEWLNVFR